MQTIPVQALPNQTLQTVVANQPVQINIYQTAYELAMDVLLAGEPLVQGQPCWNMNLMVRLAYLGLVGDFVWIDTQGTTDPSYQGLGTRYQLLYLDATDIDSLGLPTGES